ncbi:MAG: glycosyltransferase [Deltaproteobacteria bacterium]|nr:glycosyltransferase [Deltaproteobacteria bacterium]
MCPMDFSIIIPTVGRCDSLRRLLASIATHFHQSGVEYEVLVANNAPDDKAARGVDEIVVGFQSDGRLRVIRVAAPGKCKAANAAVKQARGQVVVFFDDDVEVTPEWLKAAVEFFRTDSFDAMQGPIWVPLEMQNNDAFRRAQKRFRTIHFVNYPSTTKEIKSLTGANMAIRREVFDRVGLFDERLGPGQSGMSEDVEFAQRILAAGGKIGYRHDAGVYHEVDWSRLSEAYFRLRHEQQGRSRLLYKRQSLASILPNLLRSAISFGWYSLKGHERKQYRAKGRVFHYRAMLLEKFKPSTQS